MSQTAENLGIYSEDTCEICGAGRMECGVTVDSSGWECQRCHAYNHNGSGENAPAREGWTEVSD